MIDWLLELDKNVFLYLNGKNSPVWDGIMWWISGKTQWIPLYLILLAIIIYRERPYKFIYTVVFVAIVVLLCDQISVFIKNFVERPRPSRDTLIADMVHIVNDYRGGRYGFVSSHAANTFGVATYLAYLFKNARWGVGLFAWATIVSYSRIYLGVHYPADIIFGALLGIVIGSQCYVLKIRTMVFLERKIDNRKKIKINMETTRQQKVARQIQKDLSEIFMHTKRDLVQNKMITVTVVRMSPDLSLAKVYLSVFPSDDAADFLENLQQHHAKYIRAELGKKVRHQLRAVPELVFFIDDSLDYAEHIDELLKT